MRAGSSRPTAKAPRRAHVRLQLVHHLRIGECRRAPQASHEVEPHRRESRLLDRLEVPAAALGHRHHNATLTFVFIVLVAFGASTFAQTPAAPKTLRITFQAAETGFDPVRVSDYYSGTSSKASSIRCSPTTTSRVPVKLVPNATEALPEISADGSTYTFRITAGHLLHARSGLQGRRRELTAVDYAYSIKRFIDPTNRSPYAFLFDGKIVGLAELAAARKKAARSTTTRR